MGDVKQSEVLSIDGVVIKTSETDYCIRIHNRWILLESLIVDRGVEYIVGQEFRYQESFFESFDSRVLEIFMGSNLSMTVRHFQVVDSVQKSKPGCHFLTSLLLYPYCI